MLFRSGVYNDIQDAEGFRAVCQQGLEMGFDGKTLIHPTQVEPCNEVFAPSEADLVMAGRIVTVTKHGRPVVSIQPVHAASIDERRAAIAELRSARAGRRLGMTPQQAIAEGRR